MNNYYLGNYISGRRKEMDLSLREFGKLTNISHTTIDIIEKGFDPRTQKPVNITNNTFKKISDALNVPISFLVELSEGHTEEKSTLNKESGLSEKERLIYERFSKLSPENLDIALAQLDVLLKHQEKKDNE